VKAPRKAKPAPLPAVPPVAPCGCGGFFQDGAYVHAETCERERVPENILRVDRACDELRNALVAALAPGPVEGLGKFLVTMAEAFVPKPIWAGLAQGPTTMTKRKRDHYYSGDGSTAFWDRVNALGARHGELYSLGCVLQNVEEFVLRQLVDAEAAQAQVRAKKTKRMRPSPGERR